MADHPHEKPPIEVTSFSSFAVNQTQTFDITFANKNIRPNDVSISIRNPILGSLDKQLEWLPASKSNSHDQQQQQQESQQGSKCLVSFKATSVGLYIIKIDLLNEQAEPTLSAQFQACAYDLSKVFINGSTGRCRVNESYEFGVDASEAGEGQLEIAVNEGEIPNQVQVLDNGKCIVNFVPEDAVPHVVDIKFNGHNVNGCPFVVQVDDSESNLPTRHQQLSNTPTLSKEDRILVNTVASFAFENIDLIEPPSKHDLLIIDPENKAVNFKLTSNQLYNNSYRFEFEPASVGDYVVELKPSSRLLSQLPTDIIKQFPFSIKVFDFNKVIVSDVTDGVVGQPIYFFIDASQAGSGNLEIRVSSKTRNVPNYPQSEANAKIRVQFTPTEAVEHSIDVKFNGISVPNNPFRVNVSQFPQARLPVTSQDLLKYVAINETIQFNVDYIGQKKLSEMSNSSCQCHVLGPDFSYLKINGIQLVAPGKQEHSSKQQQAQFRIPFRPSKIGPFKLFITVNNELLPNSPILCNVYNINEVKVLFERVVGAEKQPVGKLNDPVTFTVDASRAGEGTLALAVVSSLSRSPLQTEVKVSEKGHGLYNLTFLPTEFAPHSIDMSFNDRVVPESPFVVDILNEAGESALAKTSGSQLAAPSRGADSYREDLVQEMEAMALSKQNSTLAKNTGANKSKPHKSQPIAGLSKEDELLHSLVVHGVSLRRTPVNSTGAFIIETNRIAKAQDFDVLISDPGNNLVDVQCYLQQDGNLLAEWTPEKVGRHKIEVLYKNRPVPGSPFETESFDPSRVRIENLSTKQVQIGENFEFQLDASEAGEADLELVVTDPNDEEQAIELIACDPEQQANLDQDLNQKFSVVFKPKLVGKHKFTITLGGYEITKSPVILDVLDNRETVVKATGAGLGSAEINRSAHFVVESSKEGGELKLRIGCGDREIVPKVERRGRCYNIKYKPTDVGFAMISIHWDGAHIEGSPFSVPVNDLSQFVFLDSADNSKAVKNQLSVDYEPRIPREISVDTSKCGPGELKAEAYCRADSSIKFSIPVSQVSNRSHKITFTCPPGPEQLAAGTSLSSFPIEATYLIRFYYNNLAVPETLASITLSPRARVKQTNSGQSRHPIEANNNDEASPATRVVASETQARSVAKHIATSHENPIVALRGHGLVEAKSGERAEFSIDGRNVGHGKPEVRLFCEASGEDVRVKLEQIEENLFKASYEPQSQGDHTLNVHWDGKQVAGCPISVNVKPGCDPSKVVCTADSLKGGILGEKMKTFIDTKKAGPGELTALCTGPQKVAFCELLDRGDGTFILYIKPQEAGRHFLTINYDGQHIPKSPFSFKVSGRPDPTKVRVYGPGVEHGVLSLYQSRFVCDTRGAGAGQLTVRIRGPKGAFRMETQRESQRDRTILCKYDPTEPGDYRIEIKWSGCHVPGSPFSVMIFDTQEELNRFTLSKQQQSLNSNGKLTTSGSQRSALAHQSPLGNSFQASHANYYSPNSATNQQSLYRLQ